MGYQRLEGNPPDRFDGNRAHTRRFLLQFRQYMLMNDDASISRNNIKKCTYFLSLIEGPKVEGWTEQMYEWLDAAKKQPHGPYGTKPLGTCLLGVPRCVC